MVCSEKFAMQTEVFPSFGTVKERAMQNLIASLPAVFFPDPCGIPGVPSFRSYPGSNFPHKTTSVPAFGFNHDTADACGLTLIKDWNFFTLNH